MDIPLDVRRQADVLLQRLRKHLEKDRGCRCFLDLLGETTYPSLFLAFRDLQHLTSTRDQAISQIIQSMRVEATPPDDRTDFDQMQQHASPLLAVRLFMSITSIQVTYQISVLLKIKDQDALRASQDAFQLLAEYGRCGMTTQVTMARSMVLDRFSGDYPLRRYPNSEFKIPDEYVGVAVKIDGRQLVLGSIHSQGNQRLVPLDKCAYCLEHAPTKCQNCRQVRYCGKACQRADWPLHKEECGLIERQLPQFLLAGRFSKIYITKSDDGSLKVQPVL